MAGGGGSFGVAITDPMRRMVTPVTRVRRRDANNKKRELAYVFACPWCYTSGNWKTNITWHCIVLLQKRYERNFCQRRICEGICQARAKLCHASYGVACRRQFWYYIALCCAVVHCSAL